MRCTCFVRLVLDFSHLFTFFFIIHKYQKFPTLGATFYFIFIEKVCRDEWSIWVENLSVLQCFYLLVGFWFCFKSFFFPGYAPSCVQGTGPTFRLFRLHHSDGNHCPRAWCYAFIYFLLSQSLIQGLPKCEARPFVLKK